MKWTQKQQEVIDARGCNLLVSAAAGSGKTAVLVERIIHLICDEKDPVDIDRLLVMTFTSAAAGEMRERIARAIEEKLMENPEREHLQVQAALVHRASITTIDSFCLSLIRDYFNVLDLDPAFRIGDEGELMLLRADVMSQMLEDYYQMDDPAFKRFVETYAQGKSDSGIEDPIMQVYTFSQSNPFPEEWLDSCRQELDQLEQGDFDGSGWMGFLLEDVKKQAGELAQQLEGAMEVCREEGGPTMYLPTLQAELSMVRAIGQAADYETLHDRLEKAVFDRMAAARGKDIDKAKKEYAAAARDRVKKAVKSLAQRYGSQSLEEVRKNLLGSREAVLKLLELAQEFDRRYQEAKKDRNLVDFNDLEHQALRILVEKEGNRLRFTPMADELSQRYAHILVDEYQDSNDVQETLLKSLSAKRFGRPNVFMVGDVKQSIYKFRLARPELFMKKYACYDEYGQETKKRQEDCLDGETLQESEDREEGKKIELRQNFRSRASVLDSINQVFFQIMTRNLGNIQYTDKVSLHAGAAFEETEMVAGTPTELILTDTGAKALGPGDEELEEYTSREIEARLIASRIKELTDKETGLSVWDKETGQYRRAQYGDMVILLRSLTGWTDSFLNVLTQEDIPAFAETGTGYFDTIEVETVLAMLSVIDNPIQDIPLAAVLRSPVAGMEDEELAWMMAAWKQHIRKGQDRGIYGALRLVILGEEPVSREPEMDLMDELLENGRAEGIQWGKEDEISGKNDEKWDSSEIIQDNNKETWEKAPENKGKAEEESLDDEETWEDLTQEIEKTDDMWGNTDIDWDRSREMWEELADSIDMPKDAAASIHRKASAFVRLFGELRNQAAYVPIHELIHRMYLLTGYYDHVSAMPAGELRKANLDMLIEKAAAYEKTSYRGLFHFIRYIQRLRKYDTDFGEATTAGNVQDMVRIMSIHKSKGLEFPIVILAGLGKNFNKQDVRGKLLIDADLGIGADCFDVETRVKAETLKKNVLKRKLELDNLGEELRVLYVAMTRAKEKLIMTGTDRYLEKKLERWQQRTWDTRQIPYTILSTASSYLDWVLMCQPEKSPLFSVRIVPVETLVGEAVAQRLQKEVSQDELENLDLTVSYHEETETLLKERLSFRYPFEADIDLHTKISVSQLKKQGQDVDDKNSLFQPLIPEFLKEDKAAPEPGGAARGSVYHRVLELLDLKAIHSCQDLDAWLETARAQGRITEEAFGMVDPKKLWTFLNTPMGKRMSLAHKEGRLHREQQFVMGIPACDMDLGSSRELVLIQGIIDAWMEESDGLVLVDYKTDRVKPGQEQLLAKRYKVQLDYYKKALEQMVKRPVKEMVIYSLTLQKEILV